MISLRPYQQHCLEAITRHYERGVTRQLVALPTASGKTVVFASLLAQSNSRSLVIAHTNELLTQARDKIQMVCPSLTVGIAGKDENFGQAHVIIASIQWASRNTNKLPKDLGVMIVDEAHHAAAKSYTTLIKELGFFNDDRLIVGFTATAFREDERNLSDVFQKVSFEIPPIDLIEEGYLCPPKGIRVKTDLDLSSVRMEGADFAPDSLREVMDTPEMRSIAVKAYIEKANNRPSICFSVDVAHAENLAKDFKEGGITAEVVSGKTPKQERDAILDAFQKGKIKVLCNCMVLAEGFDAPLTSAIIIARPTRSRIIYTQMAGRGLRIHPEKDFFLLIDFSDAENSLCNAADLIGRGEQASKYLEKERRRGEVERAVPHLPKKLKAALIEFDPIGNRFKWEKIGVGGYSLSGGDHAALWVREKDGEHEVYLMKSKGAAEQIASGLDFNYAIGTAEDYARGKNIFNVSDKEAKWRGEPASEKQLLALRKYGAKKGLEGITKGLASDLITTRFWEK